jgi:acetyl-CoA C-acetyltransferase
VKEVWILGGARTPHATWARGRRGDGSPGGALKAVDVFDLGAAAVRGALERSGAEAGRVDALVFGSAYHSHANSCYGSRYVGLRAGLPEATPCYAVNLGCGTALQAIGNAAQLLEQGSARLAVAGGSESTSNIPKDFLFPSFNDLAAGTSIGGTVEAVASAMGITREQADGWALRSHAHARLAQDRGLFREEIVPVAGLGSDDHVLARPDPAHFARAKASYAGGIVTGANAHGLVDAGAAVVLSAGFPAGGPALGRLAGWAVAGTAPARMAYASVPALEQALARAGWKLADVDLFEVNETFAAQLLVVQKALSIPSERLNVNGGAVALGHPFGATGARLVLTLLLELRRRKARRGAAAVCVGGGQGAAVAVEAA